jgi:hypothetical protein
LLRLVNAIELELGIRWRTWIMICVIHTNKQIFFIFGSISSTSLTCLVADYRKG